MSRVSFKTREESVNIHVLSESEIIDIDASLADEACLFMNNLCLLKTVIQAARTNHCERFFYIRETS